jgi:glycerol-3-phosphate acyltransferase PlsY
VSEDGAVSIAIALGYLLGSIPFGYLLPRTAGFGDIRAIGSGNIGATNVLRTGSKGLALAVLLLDGGKGALAVIVAAAAHGEPEAYFAAGIAALFGHLFPIWLSRDRRGIVTLGALALGLTLALAQSSPTLPLLGVLLLLAVTVTAWGGKGRATSFGVLLAAVPLVGVLSMLTWLAAAVTSKRSSVGALAASAAAPIFCLLVPLSINSTLQALDWQRAAFALLLELVVILRHHDNIQRLLRGEEPTIQLSRPAPPRP